MRLSFIIAFLLLTNSVSAQETFKIEFAGQKLKDFYIAMNVENLWIAGHHVNWQTGEPDMPESTVGVKTHCSAFIAAACYKLNIYVLRPPEHGQVLLANAQYDWLNSDAATKQGWTILNTSDLYQQAQQFVNQGKIVIAIYKNTNRKKPGHVALVMPSNRSLSTIDETGPEIIMAGTHNHNYIALRNGFKSHITTWPSPEIAFFVHDSGL